MAGGVDLFSGSSSLTGANLWQTDKNPLQQLDQGTEDVIGKQANAVGNAFWDSIQMLIDTLLGIPVTGSPNSGTGFIDEIDTMLNNLWAFLGGTSTPLTPTDPNFLTNLITSAENFVINILWPSNTVAPITSDGSSAGITGLVPLENLALDLIGDVIGGAQGLIDAILAIVGFPAGSGTTSDVNTFFTDVYTWLGEPELTNSAYNAAAAVENWIISLLQPTNMLTPMDPATSLAFPINIPGLDASKIISGLFPQNMVENLESDLAAIQDGLATGNAQEVIDAILDSVGYPPGSGTVTEVNQFFSDFLSMFDNPNLTLTSFHPVLAVENFILNMLQPTNLVAPMNPSTQLLSSTNIPGLDATKIVSGIFSALNIPGLDASKIISGLFPNWLMPLIPVGSVGQTTPNLLANPTYDSAVAINDPTGTWAFDATHDHTGTSGSGSAKVIANGTLKQLQSDPATPVAQGQILSCSHWLMWNGAAGTGVCFSLSVAAYLAGSLVSSTTLASLSSPTANSGWTQLTGTYTVPSGVDTIRLQLSVLPAASAGTVWWDDASITKTQLFSQAWTAGLIGDINNLTTGVDARALQTDVISLVNAIGTGSYASIGASLSDIGTRLQHLLVAGLFDAQQLFNVANIPVLPAASVPGLDATKIITGILNILQIPTSSLGATNILDLGHIIDNVTNSLIGVFNLYTGTTPTQALGSMNSLYSNVTANTSAVQALQAVSIGTDASGITVTVNFAGYANGPLPSIFTTTYSGSGTSALGISGGNAGWFPLNNDGNRSALTVYNAQPTNTDFQRVSGVMASPPSAASGGGTPRIWVIGRVDNPANPQNYVWARGYSTGFLSYAADIGCTVGGVDTVWASNIPLTWALSISLVLGANGNPRQYQAFSGGQLVYQYTESTPVSQLGAGFRYWGAKTEMKTGSGAAVSPGTVSSTSVADNAPPTTVGSYARVHRASTGLSGTSSSGDTRFPPTSFDTTDRNTSDITFTAAANAFTVNKDGTYRLEFMGNLTIQGGAPSNQNISPLLYVNNALVARGHQEWISSPTQNRWGGSFDVYLQAGDFVQPGLNLTTNSWQVSGDAAGQNCWMSLALVNWSTA